MPSTDVFNKLFDVERRAEALVDDAQSEAAARVSSAKEKAEIAFKASYEAAARASEERRARAEAEADAEYQSAIRAYKTRLENAPLDRSAFKEACERYLAGIS